MPENGAHFSGQGHLIEAVILGDDNKTVIPVVCDSQGRLIIDLSGGSVVIGKVQIEDTNGNPIIANNGKLETQLFAVNDVTNLLQALTVKNENGGLNVTAQNFGVPGSSSNEFSEVLAPSGVETVILTRSVIAPVAEFDIIQCYGWGDYDGEFFIRIDGTQKGGGRTSAADRILYIAYDLGPIKVFPGQTVTVSILHYAPGARLFKCNLMAGVHD
jgi:hypothetical protein